jgi:HAMP domain-containing protein
MPDDKVDKARSGEPEPQVGDAGLLFRDTPVRPSGPSSAAPGPASDSGDEFALVDVPEEANDKAVPTFPAPPRAAPGAPVAGETAAHAPVERKAAPPRDDSRLDPSTLVEETWSRWSEWGSNLIVVGGWMTVLLLLVYFVFGQDYYGLAFVLLMVGLLVAVVLAYPMLITLERPVRVTPEQALRDYYGALSHHVPHFRRMWLLLSSAGRVSAAYGSFEGFKGYWKEQLARLRDKHAGPLTPLVFEVVDFKSEKSAGKTRIDTTYTVNVSVRGQRSAGAIHRIPVASALVKGPDNMWYLEIGTLPRGEHAGKSARASGGSLG